MNRRLFSNPAWPMAALMVAALLLPASAQEPEKPTEKQAPPPASAEAPAAPKESAEESDVPPDLGENVSADNNVSFPVDI